MGIPLSFFLSFCTCKILSIINKGFNIEAPSVSQCVVGIKAAGVTSQWRGTSCFV
uniref:Uncharacterized protein n=1 Tax=Helianthus annuus TaxID=4232 RepID=A0A251TC43_HELAN